MSRACTEEGVARTSGWGLLFPLTTLTMAVKLEPLVILSKGARADQGLIPFSDYSRWERRRGDKGPHKKSKQGVSQVPPSDLKSAAITPVPRGAEDARSVHGQRYRLMLKSAPVRIRLSTKHYEPARIRMLKVRGVLLQARIAGIELT